MDPSFFQEQERRQIFAVFIVVLVLGRQGQTQPDMIVLRRVFYRPKHRAEGT